MQKRYAIETRFDTTHMWFDAMDLTANIAWEDDDGRKLPTQFQTADANGNPDAAARLIYAEVLGREHWGEHADRVEDVILSVEEVLR